MHRQRHYQRGAAVLVSFLAVMRASAQPSASMTRDSAGIRIVESFRPLWTPGKVWTLAASPVLSIGPRDGPAYVFSRIAAATRLSDGSVVVAERADVHLRIFDSTGRYVRTVGRKGQGPGEFSDIGIMTRLPGDSLAVESLRYTSIIAPDGQFVRQVRYGPFAPDLVPVPLVAVLGRFPNGSAVVGDFPQGRRAARVAARWVDSSTLLLVNASGAVERPLERVPAAAFAASVGPPTLLTFGPELMEASAANHVYLAFGDQYAIREYDATWTLKRIVRRAWTAKPLTAPEWDAYVDAWMTLWSTDKGSLRERDRLARSNAPHPDVLPAFVDFLASPSGDLWLRDPDLTDAARCACLSSVTAGRSTWSVFDASGRWLGEVRMPARFTPAEVGSDYVLGQQRDPDNVLRVVMYRIVKPRD